MACFLVTSYAQVPSPLLAHGRCRAAECVRGWQELVVKSLNFNHSMIVSASIPLVGVIGARVPAGGVVSSSNGGGVRAASPPLRWRCE